MLEIQFYAELHADPDSCDNVGLCCLSCPMYDACDHHYEEETS